MSDIAITVGRWLAAKIFAEGGKNVIKSVGGPGALVAYKAVQWTFEGLVKLEEGRDKACLTALKQLYDVEGRGEAIALLDGKGQWVSRKQLESFVTGKGGTAWNQEIKPSGWTGIRALNAFWHPKRGFEPKEFPGAPLGHVVHGTRDYGD